MVCWVYVIDLLAPALALLEHLVRVLYLSLCVQEDQPVVRGLLHYLHWDTAETRKRLCGGRSQLLVEAHLRPAPSDPPAEKVDYTIIHWSLAM